MGTVRSWLAGMAVLVGVAASLPADEPVTLDNVIAPEPNSAESVRLHASTMHASTMHASTMHASTMHASTMHASNLAGSESCR